MQRSRPKQLYLNFPELIELEELALRAGPWFEQQIALTRHHEGHDLPLYYFFNQPSCDNPPLLFVTAGIHGVERIGTILNFIVE